MKGNPMLWGLGMTLALFGLAGAMSAADYLWHISDPEGYAALGENIAAWWQQWWPWVALGLGVPALITGIVLAVRFRPQI